MATYSFLVAKAQDPSGKPLAISASANSTTITVEPLNYADPLQMWEKREVTSRVDAQHPIFGLINKSRNMCISRTQNNNGTPLVLKSPDTISFSDLAMWRREDWGGLNSYADWEQKINIPGNGPYRDGQSLVTWKYSGGASNESWNFVAEASEIQLVSINFDIDAKQVLGLTPENYTYQLIDNGSDIAQPNVQTSYTSSVEDSYSCTDETGIKISTDTSLTVGIPVIDAKAKISLKTETNFKFSTTKATSTNTSVTATFSPTVPAKGKVKFTAMILSGKIDVPYTAQVKYIYPNGVVEQKSLRGTFSRVSAYNFTVKIDNV